MTPQPLVAVVLLNFNGQSYLERNIPFLLQTSYINKQIVVIDNASSDNSVSFLKVNYPSVSVIELTGNHGYAGGYNLGLEQLKADYFILVNTDVEVTQGFIEPLIATLCSDPGAGICQPKILSLENRNKFEYAGAAGGFMDKLGYTFARGRILNKSEEDTAQYEQDIEIFWASGACFAIEVELFRQLRGFYDFYFMYSEEVDLCWRAQLAGKKVLYCHSSLVYHKETDEFIKQSAKRIYYVFRNNFIMLCRNLTAKDKLRILPARIVLNTAAAFHFFLQGHFRKSMLVMRSILASLKWLLLNKKEIIHNRKPLGAMHTVYKKNILSLYYFKKIKKFSALDHHHFSKSEA